MGICMSNEYDCEHNKRKIRGYSDKDTLIWHQGNQKNNIKDQYYQP